ncbi:protein kinase domain-containing protein [Parendozoicomonas haliclonae]|uniref:Serine/threonine-protein kinase StkP n=1 Tax=Parendozoicomonas haliclonae TaxID=1960125 RepID=A0A1X7AML2_9GAMM|nr:protein kinase [Parendozoicomonas haliclonae]SMA49500.1 Serine/threonine-protein kinase StkP [Parendozoicomonas haliclonae]
MAVDYLLPATDRLPRAGQKRVRPPSMADNHQSSSLIQRLKKRAGMPLTSSLQDICAPPRDTPPQVSILDRSTTPISLLWQLSSLNRMCKPLGSGVFGSVYKIPQVDGLPASFACKTNNDIYCYQSLKREAELAVSLDHPNLLKYLGAVTRESLHNKSIEVYMECMAGSLADDLDRPHTTLESLQYLRDIAAGLSELHRRQLVHNDIKIDNILLSPTGTAVVGDFGRTRRGVLPLEEVSTIYPPEMSPIHPYHLERISSSNSDQSVKTPDSGIDIHSPPGSPTPEPVDGYEQGKADIYGLGYIGLQLLTQQKVPHVWSDRKEDPAGDRRLEPFRKMLANNPAALYVLEDIIAPCLNLDINRRPSSVQILERIDLLIQLFCQFEK